MKPSSSYLMIFGVSWPPGAKNHMLHTVLGHIKPSMAGDPAVPGSDAEMFCVECGSEEMFTDVLCRECFLRKHELVRTPAVKKATICSQCEALARKLGSRGPLNVQGRLRDGVFLPFEVNPRFSASTYLRALAGVNELAIYLRNVCGRGNAGPE